MIVTRPGRPRATGDSRFTGIGVIRHCGAGTYAMETNKDNFSMPPILWETKYVEGHDQRDDLIDSVLGLAEEGIPVNMWPPPPAGAPTDELDGELSSTLEKLGGEPPADGGYVSILHADPGSFARDENADYCIGRTAVGTLRVPEPSMATAGLLDEIWVPSGFSRMALAASGVPEETIQIFPSCVDAESFCPSDDTLSVNRNSGFVFATVLDWDYRRGLDIVLEAFVREFRNDEEVSLILKSPGPQRASAAYVEGECGPSFWSDLEGWLHARLRDREPAGRNDKDYEDVISAVGDDRVAEDLRREREVERRTAGEIREAVHAEMKKNGAGLPDIKVISRTLPRRMIPRLYSACDAFVMAPRAELWGRPFLESMAVGLPTIGTKWGGHLDFMRPDNSFLIGVRSLINIDDEDKLGRGGLRMAEPDVQHLRELMRRVFEHSSDARERGARASAQVRSKYSRARVASQMAERLAGIAGENGLVVAEAA